MTDKLSALQMRDENSSRLLANNKKNSNNENSLKHSRQNRTVLCKTKNQCIYYIIFN